MAANFSDQPVQVYDASDALINPAKEDGNLAGIKSDLDTINTNTLPKGQATMANSSPVVIASDQSAVPVTVTPNFATRSDTYTVAASGTTVNKSAAPVTAFAVQVKGTGAAPTSWTVVLEASLDNVNFSTVLTHKTSTGDGAVMWSGSLLSPTLYFRSRCTAISLGSATNIVVTILGSMS